MRNCWRRRSCTRRASPCAAAPRKSCAASSPAAWDCDEGVALMSFAPGLLAGKRALITGGGTGLGKSIGCRFVELGAHLTICGRREGVLAATAEEFRRELGAEIGTHVCDVREVAAVETMLARAFAAGPLDILVNNAAGNFIAQSHRL